MYLQQNVPLPLSHINGVKDRPVHVQGTLISTGEDIEFWVTEGQISFTKVKGAITIAQDGLLMPGLVDAHCHVGLGPEGGVEPHIAEDQARQDRATGVSLIRDAGAPIDTHWLDDVPEMPTIIRCGRHIARPKRYIRHFGAEVAPEDLVEEVRRQVAAGDGWVKLVGDWIDRDLGDLSPLWPEEVAREAIDVAHELGARVTAHCFAEESVAQLVNAGIDCIEHGTGLDEATCQEMARRGVALVPTLDNVKIFPGIADQAEDHYPTYAKHMRHLYQRAPFVVYEALQAGVQVFAGTDAGGTRDHGTIMDEIWALTEIGGPGFAVGAASWEPRRWLGAPELTEGSTPDLLLLSHDPRIDPRALAEAVLLFA
ncbi:MAG: amidohydrolase family protein [Propionibacteriaceae bacterium]|nr:amidohydrolase family protein [Propionibacteriaceae bacterium]